MTINTISTLPTAPARTDAPATFISRADSFLAALVVMQTELNTSIGQMNTDISGVNADATAAAASATAAANASNADAWVSGTTYALGDVVYSPVDYQSYRRIVAGAGTTDPSSDATNWTKISAEPLPAQTGNAGKFLTTDGSSASWADAGGLSADFVASGTLSSGQTVALKADGTVEAVAAGGPSSGSPVVFESATSAGMSATFDSNSNKIIIAYRDNGNSFYGTAIVGTVSGTSISFGTPVVFDSAFASDLFATFDSNANKVVIAYADGNNSYYGTAIVGTVSGTSISFGSSVVFESATSAGMSATFDSTSNKVVISYQDGGNSYYGTAIVGTVSGTSISFGTPTVFESANSGEQSATFDSNSNKIVIAYRDAGNSQYGTAVVGTVSGTSISFGTPTVFDSAYTSYSSATFDSNSNKVVIAYQQDATSSKYGAAIVGTVSGTSISFGTAVVFESAASAFVSATFDSISNKVVIAYQDGGNSSYGTAIVGTVSGTSISFGSPVIFEAASTTETSSTFDANLNKIVIAYADGGNSGYGTSAVLQAASTNYTDFIGITDAAISDTASGSVTIKGGISTNVTGLTPNQTYYVQTDGSLSTTVSSVTAGKALSSTSMLLKGI